MAKKTEKEKRQVTCYWNLPQLTGPRLVFFQSSDVSHRNYHRLLWSVPDDLLYHFSLGNDILIFDKPSRKILIFDKSSRKIGLIERPFVGVLQAVLYELKHITQKIDPDVMPGFDSCARVFRDDWHLNNRYAYWVSRWKNIGNCIKGVTIPLPEDE